MGFGSDLMEMNKRQRRGAIVVLAVIALLLVATVAVRSCRATVPHEVVNVDLQQFEAQADSSASPADVRPVKKATPTTRKPRRSRHPKPPRPSREPRPVEPVPQF